MGYCQPSAHPFFLKPITDPEATLCQATRPETALQRLHDAPQVHGGARPCG